MMLKKSFAGTSTFCYNEDAFSTKGSNGVNGGPRIKILRFPWIDSPSLVDPS